MDCTVNTTDNDNNSRDLQEIYFSVLPAFQAHTCHQAQSYCCHTSSASSSADITPTRNSHFVDILQNISSAVSIVTTKLKYPHVIFASSLNFAEYFSSTFLSSK